jgi:RimJ/RimL family protein N-acetyltransferase
MNNKILNKIQLRKIKKSDWPYFLLWWKDKELIKMTSGIYEKSDNILKGYFLNMLNSVKNHHYLILLDKKPIGNISLTHKNKSTFEMHIVIGEKEYWGRGFGTAATKEALKIAFDTLGYKRAHLEVRPENKRAINLYKDCGFTESGLKRYPNNKFQPVVLKMTLLK